MSGIADRLRDAKLLYDEGRYEGALLNVLIAAAGTARRRFPEGTMGDRASFETFMANELRRAGPCSVLFGGQCVPAEQIFYRHLRCSLAHEAELPAHVELVAGESPLTASICRAPGPPERLIISFPLVLMIAHLVATAAENADVSPDVRRSLHPSPAVTETSPPGAR